MLSTPTQQGPTKAPVNTPPSGPDTSRGSPGTTGSVSPPAGGALASALAAVLGAADGGAAVGAADGAAALGAVLVAAEPQAVTRRETITNINIGVRPLAHRSRSMLVLLICTGRGQGNLAKRRG